jgi:hypothetical protein
MYLFIALTTSDRNNVVIVFFVSLSFFYRDVMPAAYFSTLNKCILLFSHSPIDIGESILSINTRMKHIPDQFQYSKKKREQLNTIIYAYLFL